MASRRLFDGAQIEIGSLPIAAAAATNITASLAATESGPDIFSANAVISQALTASLAATESGPDILAADIFVGYKVTGSLAASEVGPDIFAGSAFIGTPPPPIVVDITLIKLRSFTDRRRM